MTTIIATHEMKFAQDVADQIVFLDQGKVIETGSPKNFFQ
jgi:ABC-type polar amino acid transport system ATPase subunit